MPLPQRVQLSWALEQKSLGKQDNQNQISHYPQCICVSCALTSYRSLKSPTQHFPLPSFAPQPIMHLSSSPCLLSLLVTFPHINFRTCKRDADFAACAVWEWLWPSKWLRKSGECYRSHRTMLSPLLGSFKQWLGVGRHRRNWKLIVIDGFLLEAVLSLWGWGEMGRERALSCNTTDYLNLQSLPSLPQGCLNKTERPSFFYRDAHFHSLGHSNYFTSGAIFRSHSINWHGIHIFHSFPSGNS